MASRHEIVSIDFRANAGKANPAIESLKASAEAANKKITELRANLEKGGTAKQIEDWNKEITALDKKVKTLENAQRTLVKGVGTLNQALDAFNNGSLDQMSAKFQKAAKNAAELQKQTLDPKNDKYKQYQAELEAFTARVDENLQKMKLHTDDLIATIQAGGKVSASELRQEINGLTELLDLIPKGTEEYKQYASQLQTIQTHVTTLSENERRLAGEIVTVADAMKMANASTREAAEQRLKDAAAAKQQAETERATLETQREASRLKIETAEKEAASIKEQITEQEKLVKSQDALYEASDRADKEVDEARKKRDAARESTKQYTDAITKAANEVADLKKQLEELNATTAKPKVDTSEVEKLKGEVESVQKEINILLQDNLFNMMSLSHKELPHEWDLENQGFTQKFTEKFGLQESYANRRKYIATKGMFRGPEDTDMWDIEEFYKNADDNGWGYTKQDWKEILDDYKWFEESLQAVVESIGKQYEKLSHAAYMGADPETLKGMANGIKKLEELKERMLSIAAKDKEYQLEHMAGQGTLFREQFGDVEGDMKKAVETVERGLKEITGMRSKAIEKRVQEDKEYYEQQIKNNETEIESKKAVIAQTNQQIEALEKLAGSTQAETEAIKGQGGELDKLKAKLEEVKVQRATTNQRIERRSGEIRHGGDAETWQAILTDVQGSKDGRLRSMFIGETKKQFDDVLDVANRFYNIMKKIGTDLGGKQYGSEATEPIKKLAEAYKITEEEARKLLRTLVESTEVQKKYSFSFDERFGLNHVHIQQRKDKDKDLESYSNKTDQQIRIETAEAQLKRAQEWESQQTEAIDKLKKEEQELARQEAELTEQIKRGGEATEQSVDADKKKAEVTKQLADAQAELDRATKDAEEPKKKLAKAEDDLTEAEKKQTKAYEDLNTARNKQDFAGQNEKLDQLERQYDELTGSIEKEKQAITENATAAKEAYDKETEAAIDMAQAQNYSQKSLEDSIALLEKQSKVETDPKKYKEMTTAIETMQQRVKEMTGEWMSYAEAEKYAESIGTDGFIATSDQLQKATQSIQRHKDALIKSIQKRRESKNLTEEEKKALVEEEAELKKVEAELKKMKFEMDNANMSSKRMHEILKDPKSAKNIEELSAAIKRSTQELKLMEETIGRDNAKYKEMAEQTKKATIEQKNMEAQFKASSSAFEKAWSRLKTYVGLYVGAAVAMQKIVATMGDLMELSDKMGEVRKTTGFTADEVGRLSDNLKKLDVRTSLTSLMELSSLAGSVGLKTQQDVQGFTEAANQLLIALPEMGNESARTLIKIAQATGDLQKNNNDVRETLEKVGSTIIALRANSASAAGPITDFVSRVGAVGAQAGISIDQIAALGSTIDALGGRVEMSATALSRMIPAIRNNTFEVARAIGMTEKELKGMSAMEQMVTIFQKLRDGVKQYNTDTEEGMNAMADNVEAVLSKSPVMAEVMKELNQQGARAGIVFGLLSQNVDELQKQLGIAGEAYKDNIALQEEFNKMNDTTAAKWARLKNQLEEMFVSDSAQRWLGGLIDNLRKLVDIISGDVTGALKALNVAVWTAAAAFTAFRLGTGEMFIKTLGLLKTGILGVAKAIVTLTTVQGWKNMISGVKTAIGVTKMYISLQWKLVLARDAETKATIKAQLANNALAKSMNANIWMAIIAAIGMLVYKLYDWVQASKEAGREAAKFQAELDKETAKVDKLFESVGMASVRTEEAAKKVDEARKALKAAQEQLDGSKESTDRLTEAEGNLAKAEMDLQKEQDNHAGSIKEINSQYGKYLGFMLSEVASAQELIEARELLNDKLRETITLKNKEAALGRVEEGMGKDRDESYSYLWDKVQDIATSKDANGKDVKDATKATRTINAITKAAQKSYESLNDFSQEVLKIARENEIGGNLQPLLNYAQKYYLQLEKIRNKTAEIEQQFSARESVNREQSQKDFERQYQTAVANYNKLEETYTKASGDAKKKAAADLLKQMDTINEMVDSAERHYELDEKKAYEGEIDNYNNFIKQTNDRIKAMGDQRGKLLKEAGDAYAGNKPKTGNNKPYGDFNRVTSAYGEWDADSLVARRKEMLERVRSLANGADVQKVLSEDAKFISEAVRNNIKTTEQAIEWYNAERLKIQDALHEKHLTPTGDWENPTVKKAREKQLKAEWKAYFDELDAYYTERKAKIQQAQTDEGLSEEEAQRQIVLNEQIWRQRRMELGKMFADKSAEVTDSEQQAIYQIIADRQEDTVDMVEKSIAQVVKFSQEIGKKSPEELRDYMGKLDKQIQQDFLKQQNAISKQLNAIRDIIAKERPYDGITENLRKSLSTMGILLADFEAQAAEAVKAGKEPVDDQAARAEAEMQRLAFVLQQAESAYTLTVEEMMKRMADAGMKAWADELEKNPQMQQALMAQLRKTYDEIQEAIKKEATLIKKQVDIWWADIAPGADQSRKDTFERALSQMGLLEDSVKRANQLIGAGQASERVADKLAIKQMQIRLAMQATYYNKMRQVGEQRIAQLKAAGKEEDALHLQKSLNLAQTQEQVKLDEQRVAIANKLEESQNRLYTAMREYADLMYSSMQSVFEASNAGAAEFYNERAKLQLTGGTGETQQYIVIDNAGTSGATAHYETLNEMQAAERKFEIERQNAQADAWKKVMDDFAAKLNETITDQLNAMLQSASIDANTQALESSQMTMQNEQLAVSSNTSALGANTIALNMLAEKMAETGGKTPSVEVEPLEHVGYDNAEDAQPMPLPVDDGENVAFDIYKAKMAADDAYTEHFVENAGKRQKVEVGADKKSGESTQSMFAKMTIASNMYGIAYQAMANDNMSITQKFASMAIQSAGNAAITMLNVEMSKAAAKAATDSPGVLGTLWKQLGWAAAPVFAIFTGLLGGLMGLASSKISKSKSEIAAATGTSNSVASGRLVTGMLTYASGNVNELSDPSSLTVGRSYNVDGADGKTYRAKYMGKGAKTHITNGPEFHLVGEEGQEAIIDAKTTRLIRMDDNGIWKAIQTLYNGGSIKMQRRRSVRRGIPAFADGNLDDFDEITSSFDGGGNSSMSMEMAASLQSSIDRQSELLERALSEGIRGVFDVYGKNGLIDSYDTGKKTVQRYGQRY